MPLVVAKLQKLIEQDLKHVSPGGSKWASLIVVLRKSDEDIRICRDYKIGGNHRVCSDSYSMPNVKVALHALVGMNVFTKIDLKAAYHQIPIENSFKEVTTIDTPIRLLKWKRIPYGIKTASAIFQRAIDQVLREDIKKYGLLPRRYMHRSY